MKRYLVNALAAIVLIAAGCSDGSVIGNDLLEDEAIDLAFDDSYQLATRTVLGDSIATYRINSPSRTMFLGELDDPVFGKVSSDIYTGFTFGSSLPSFLENATVDSIVLYLEYAPDFFAGDDGVVHNIEVFRIEEDFLDMDTIYSDQSFATAMTPLGSKSFVPDPIGDSIRWQVRDLDVDSFVFLTPRINIPLDNSFGEEILQDTFATKSDSAIVAAFKGLYIRSTTEGSSMIALNFEKSGTISNLVAKMALFYTEVDAEGITRKRTYNYLVRNEASSNFVLDYAGSPVGNSIGDYTAGEDEFYAQGLSGVNAEVDLPDLSALAGNIINSAQLVLTVNDDDTEDYPGISQFLMSKPTEDGESRILIDDLTKTGVLLTTGLALLDGAPERVLSETGDSITTVTFNITDFVRNSIEDEISAPKLVISPVGRAETARRTVFYGSNHPTYPAKLRIAYTVL